MFVDTIPDGDIYPSREPDRQLRTSELDPTSSNVSSIVSSNSYRTGTTLPKTWISRTYSSKKEMENFSGWISKMAALAA